MSLPRFKILTICLLFVIVLGSALLLFSPSSYARRFLTSGLITVDSSCLVNDLCLSALINPLNIEERNATTLLAKISVKPVVKQNNNPAGRTYFVSPTGNDKNDGTDASKAWATFSGGIKTILNGIKGGDTVCYLSGVYKNVYYGDGNVWKNSPLYSIISIVDVSGSEGAYISIRPCEGHKVKLQFDSASAIRMSGSSYIRISGFEIEGYTQYLTLNDALQYQYAYRYIDTSNIYYRSPSETLKYLLKGVEKTATHNQNAITVGNACHHIDLFDLFIHDSTGHGIAALGGVDYVNILHNEFVNTTWWSSNGNHAVSFKGLKSIDSNNNNKIVVRGNLLRDCASKMVSWSLLKTAPVELVIDEGKGIHCQDSTSSNGWAFGKILFSDNLIIRQGNAGLTVNNAERITFANNTLIDNANINVLMKTPGQTDPNVNTNYFAGAGGIRAAGGKQCSVLNNLVVQRSGLNAFDSQSTATAEDYLLKGNVYSGGLSTNAQALNTREALRGVSLPLFQNPSIGDYSLIDKSLGAGVTLTSMVCVQLSWPEANAKFFGTNSNCAEIVLNGVESLPTKQLVIDFGNSLENKVAGDRLEATITLTGGLSESSLKVETVFVV